MEQYYNSNPDFRDYVDKYRRDHNVSVEEALTHELVRQVYIDYREKEDKHDTSK